DVVAGEEGGDAERVGGRVRADHAQAGEAPGVAEELPAGDERPEDDVGEAWVLIQHCAQGRLRHLVHVGRTAGVAADDRRSAGDLGDVAGEIPRFVDGGPVRGVPGLVHDVAVSGD